MSATRFQTVWRYGDSRTEKGRIIRNGGLYYALVLVGNVRWRVLAGCWDFKGLAFRAMCQSYMRHFGEHFTANNFDRDLLGE